MGSTSSASVMERRARAGADEAVVVTAWSSHDAFDAWIDTQDRDRLTASDVHGAVEYRPITRYDVVGGYIDLDGLSAIAESPKDAQP
jgi:heme-degrading monooxygenase HmoA